MQTERLQYSLNYSGTRFLSTENYNHILNFLVDSVFNSFNKNNLTNVFGGKKCNESFRAANILSVRERKTKKQKVITCPRSRPRLLETFRF